MKFIIWMGSQSKLVNGAVIVLLMMGTGGFCSMKYGVTFQRKGVNDERI